MELSGYLYRCSAGETFDSIALIVYDDEKYAAELICANPEYAARTAFVGGEQLRLPVIEMRTSAYATGKAPWRE